ncbi:HlyD family secretion protein [Pseudomonas sp. TE3610]
MSEVKSKRLWLALTAGATLVAAGVGYLLLANDPVQRTDDAYVQADLMLVAPKVAGIVDRVLVDDNQPVNAGQPLVHIDDRDYRNALLAAEAALTAAQARAADAQATLQRQQAMVDQAHAVLDADGAQTGFAEHEQQRYQALANQGAGTVQKFQEAQSRLRSVRAVAAEHRAALAAVLKQTDVLQAQASTAQALVRQAQAQVERAQLELSYTELHAPQGGEVGRRSVRVGSYVKPGDPLLAVVPRAQAYVVANFQENQLTDMLPGQHAEIAIDTFPGHTLKGHVDSIAPATGVTFAAIAPDNATGNFTKVVQRIPVKIVLDPDQPLAQRLRVGMSVQARIDTDDAQAQVGAR